MEAGRPADRHWATGEYLLWWLKGSPVPPLVTTSSPSSAGIPGKPGLAVLLGGSGLDDAPLSGGRFTAGLWLDDAQTLGLEGTYLFLGTRGFGSTLASPGLPGSPVLARPFFNVISQAPDSELVAFPGRVGGVISVSSSRFLDGFEVNLVKPLGDPSCGADGIRIELLAGLRYLELAENLAIQEALLVAPAVPVLGGTSFQLGDQFKTRNRFCGPQVGARAEVRRGALIASLRAAVALGTTEEEIDVGSNSVITPPGAGPTPRAGGLLALPSNSGHFSHHRFAVVPEAGLNIGYQVTPNIRAVVGYTFLYCSSVVRPGDQIDLAVNPLRVPVLGGGTGVSGPARPQPTFKETDFWAQGINFGLEVQF